MSGMPHDEAKAYLDSYLAQKSDQGMAVLIAGHWGAGKTRFVRTYFEERKKRFSRSRGAKQPPDYLYASFFGAPDEAAISDQFLSQLYPSLNSNLGKVLGTAAFRVGSALLSKVAATDGLVEPSDVGVLREWSAQPRGRVVVFDDLERAGIGVERALALINGYVERDGIRVVVIANESEIHDEKYMVWKEKVIGKTLVICADADEVVTSVGNGLPSGIVKNYVLSNVSKVSEVVRASTYPNFRSVKNLISDAHRVASGLEKSLVVRAGVVESLVLFSVGIGAELRAGKLAAAEVSERAQMYIYLPKGSEDPRPKEVREIYAKYADLGATESLISPDFLISLWETGELRTREIEKSLASNPRVVGEEATPAWRRLWSLWDLSQSSFERAKRDALEQVERSEVTIEGELLHIVGSALQVEKYGAEFFPGEKVIDWLSSYLRREQVRSNLRGTSIYERIGSGTSYAGLGYAGKDLPEFKIAREMLAAALSEIDDRRKVESLADYLGQLRDGDYESISLSGSWNENLPYGPWLHLVDPILFVPIVLNDGRLNYQLGGRLVARYESDAHSRLRKEWEWLWRVRVACRKEIAGLHEPHQTICRQQFASIQKRICQAVREARKRYG